MQKNTNADVYVMMLDARKAFDKVESENTVNRWLCYLYLFVWILISANWGSPNGARKKISCSKWF